jgi:hypothetical protein
MRSNSPDSPGETGVCSDGWLPASACWSSWPSRTRRRRRSASWRPQVGVEFAEDLDEIPFGVAGQYSAYLVQAQAQLGEAPDAGQLDHISSEYSR